MAELENPSLFAELLYSGVASLKSHPEYKTKRKKRELQPSGQHFSESYLDKIANQLGISPNTLKSWIGQMGNKYVPSRIEDGKLFAILWIILKHSDMRISWFVDILKATSIPVLDPPSLPWIKACMTKAKLQLEYQTFGSPDDKDINWLVNRMFEKEPVPTDTLEPEARHLNLSLPLQHVSHNLPTRWANIFVGRRATLELLNKWMHSASPMCLITGWGGMGKSTLVLESAYASLGEARGEAAKIESPWPRYACLIWVSADLKGMSFNYFLDTIAYQLGRVELLEHAINEKQFIVRNALATSSVNGQILIIADNLDSSNLDILDFLSNLPQKVKVIMTSREHEQQLFHQSSRELFVLQVDGLEKEDALRYLLQEAQFHLSTTQVESKKTHLSNVLSSDPALLVELVEVTAGNPKALALSIAYIADDAIPLDVFIEEIRSASFSLTSIFDYLFGHTWNRCHEDVQMLWMVLCFFHTPPDEHSWAAAAGLDRRSFHRAVDQMRAYTLIATERYENQLYYRAHQTVIAYGEQKLQEEHRFKGESEQRWGKYYIEFAEQHLQHEQLTHPYWKCLPGRDLAPVKKEWPNMFKLLQWTVERKQPKILIELMLRLSHFLSRISLPLRIEYGLKAAEAAREEKEWLLEALFRIDVVGWACYEIGNMEQGLKHIRDSLAIIEEQYPSIQQDEVHESNDLRSLANQFIARYYVALHQIDKAEEYVQRAISIEASPVIVHRTLLIQGNIAMLKSEYERAREHLEEAHRVSSTYGGEKSIESYYFLGISYIQCGQFEEAERMINQLLFYEHKANQIELIYYQYAMAQLLAKKGKYIEAVQQLQQTLTRIDSWEQGIRIRREIETLHDELLSSTALES
ncbi:tetratricopeptide repeat protein [Cohnella panacarvi]|uniref:tetratricopeptide repeat protein n=1 Tax=Cohnella panacarvi TaxID=400776 RepID=UPI00047C9C71|nr:ATP-binding protein [Cohnella panacarvi]